MSGYELSKADRQRLVNGIVGQLEDFPRQHAALESAMAEFGEDFDLGPFKDAFDSVEDLTAYNRAQAVERAVGRVQNLLTDLAMSGARLAELPVKPAAKDDSRAKPFFEALRDAEVIDAELSRRLEKGQKARSRLEHDTCVCLLAMSTALHAWCTRQRATSSAPIEPGSSRISNRSTDPEINSRQVAPVLHSAHVP